MSIDWQAYQDGTLSADQSAALSERLSSDADLRAEYEGYKAFVEAVRDAGLNEEVDQSAAEVLLKRAAKQAKPKRRRFGLQALAVAASLAIGFFAYQALTYDPMALATTPTQEIAEFSQPESAAEWVRSKTGYEVPPISLSPDAKLVSARFGDNWACYDYESEGGKYYLYMSDRADHFAGHPLQGDFYEGKGLGWYGGQMTWYLRGGGETERRLFASRAMSQTR
jgi:hypothetical protein